jgi:glycosyltransferase involved in cell wall biosynthesis
MRIAHVTDCYLPRLGGIELHIRDLVLRQRARGDEATVRTPTPAGPEADPDWVLRHPAGSHDLDLDVAHVHVSVWSPYALRAVRRLARAGVPTVVTVHSLWSRYGPVPGLAGGVLGAAGLPVVWTAVSARAAAQVRTALRVPVQVLPNAVDPEQWLRPAPVRGPGDPLTLVTVGRLSWTKRVLALPPILAAVRDRVPDAVPLRALVIGDGPQRGELERRVAGLDWVEVLGRADRAEIRDRLAGADVYVAPAALESFGIAALEARSAGLPVVAHAASGVGEFVRHGTDGFLAADDAGFVAALVALLGDDELRGRITRHNRTVRPTCDWDRACAGAQHAYRLAVSIAGVPVPRRVPAVGVVG